MDTLILNKDGNPLSILPLSVVSWQTAIKLMVLGKITVIKYHNDWEVSSPSIKMKVPSIAMTTDYIKWTKQVKFTRGNVFLRDDHTCQFCKKIFAPNVLTFDHVLPKVYGGKTNWTNIVTACKSCNNKKSDNKNIVPKDKPYRPSYYELVAKRLKLPVTVKDEEWCTYLPWKRDLIHVHTDITIDTTYGEHNV